MGAVRTVSNSGDGVVEVGSAGLGVEDSLAVEHELAVFGINRDTCWLSINSSLKLWDALLWNFGVRSSFDLALA